MSAAKTSQSLLLLLVCSLALNGCPASRDTTDSSAQQAPTTRIAEHLGDDFQDIAKNLLPAVVSISTHVKKRVPQVADRFHQFEEDDETTPQDGLGSGVIVNAEKAYVLTNNHVVEGADSMIVTLQNGKHYSAKVIGTDPPTDLAVVQIQRAPKLTAAKIGDSASLQVGEWVLAIGSPFGLDSTVTAGIISAKGRADVGVADFEDFIQTDAAINPGNSGGALVNTQGELIGINTAIATRTEGYMGIGFAIPSNLALKVMNELVDKGKVTRSQLGVYIGPIDEDLRSALKLPTQQQGILVMEVIPETPAAAIGFQKYDLIVSLNGRPVSEVQPFRNSIALTPPGRQVTIGILRQGKAMELKPTLKEASAQSAAPDAGSELQERLGFELMPLNDHLRQQLGLAEGAEGLLVKSIETDSTAYQRGLRQGDVITEVNQQAVQSWEDVQAALKNLKPGDAVLLNIFRQGQTRIMAFELPS